ncbi:phosphatidylserine decarboxylase proenzyme [Hyaloraphidium curvatum]|nr:phosphatidylserine decarboxylase proenzyme [Hyaloraphidium curvatum]
MRRLPALPALLRGLRGLRMPRPRGRLLPQRLLPQRLFPQRLFQTAFPARDAREPDLRRRDTRFRDDKKRNGNGAQSDAPREERRRPRLRQRLGFLNPAKWTSIPAWLGLLVMTLIGFTHVVRREQRLREEELRMQAEEDGAEMVSVEGPWHIQLYATLPLRMLSRLWGRLTAMTIPKPLRAPIYKTYGRMFACNFDEIAEPLDSFPTLGDFFYRELRPGARAAEPGWDLVSPADGRVLHFGIVASDETIEQVKGHSYSLKSLVGESHSPEIVSGERLPQLTDAPVELSVGQLLESDEVTRMETAPASPTSEAAQQPLYFMLIYLGPGDYHRFHSPLAPFSVKTVRHIPGELYSVSPYMVEWLKNLFVLNERVAMVGSGGGAEGGREAFDWFSMVAVGATNVGRIMIDLDENIKTNQKRKNPNHYTTAFSPPASAPMLSQLGGFKLGSSIVLVFRGPPHGEGHFEFREGLERGRRVRVGEGLGKVVWVGKEGQAGKPFDKERVRTWAEWAWDWTAGWVL